MSIHKRYVRPCNVRPFDVILCRSKGFVAALSALQNRSDTPKQEVYSHAALVVGSEFVFEAIPGEVRLVSLRHHANHGQLTQPWPELAEYPPDTSFQCRQLIEISDAYLAYDIYRPLLKRPDGTHTVPNERELSAILKSFEDTTLEQEQYKSYATLLSATMSSRVARDLDDRAKRVLQVICNVLEHKQFKDSGITYEAGRAAAEEGRFCSDLVETCFANAGYALFPDRKSTELHPNDLPSRLMIVPDAILSDCPIKFADNEVIKKSQLMVNRQEVVLAQQNVDVVRMRAMQAQSSRSLDELQGKRIRVLQKLAADALDGKHGARKLEVALTAIREVNLLNPPTSQIPSWNKPLSPEPLSFKTLFRRRRDEKLSKIYAQVAAFVETLRESEGIAEEQLRTAVVPKGAELESLYSTVDRYCERLPHQKSFEEMTRLQLASVPREADPLDSIIAVSREAQKQAEKTQFAAEELINAILNQALPDDSEVASKGLNGYLDETR